MEKIERALDEIKLSESSSDSEPHTSTNEKVNLNDDDNLSETEQCFDAPENGPVLASASPLSDSSDSLKNQKDMTIKVTDWIEDSPIKIQPSQSSRADGEWKRDLYDSNSESRSPKRTSYPKSNRNARARSLQNYRHTKSYRHHNNFNSKKAEAELNNCKTLSLENSKKLVIKVTDLKPNHTTRRYDRYNYSQPNFVASRASENAYSYAPLSSRPNFFQPNEAYRSGFSRRARSYQSRGRYRDGPMYNMNMMQSMNYGNGVPYSSLSHMPSFPFTHPSPPFYNYPDYSNYTYPPTYFENPENPRQYNQNDSFVGFTQEDFYQYSTDPYFCNPEFGTNYWPRPT